MLLKSSLALLLVAAALPAHALDPTGTAKVLAGLSTDSAAAGADKAGVLEGYTKKTSQLWDKFETGIGKSMREWARTELQRTPGETVFYPFAGPDFPTVQLLYPDAGRYVLVALQKGGRVPDMSGMPKAELNTYLRTFRGGWESFTLRGFYDTDDLKRDTADSSVLEGITPALMAFAVRLGYTIDKVEPVRIAASGADLEVHPGDKNDPATWDSVRLTMKHGERVVILDYVFLDLSDTNLGKHDNERKWIEAMAAHRVVTKAASHLMQKSFFSIIKNAILTRAPSLWQDEVIASAASLISAVTIAEDES